VKKADFKLKPGAGVYEKLLLFCPGCVCQELFSAFYQKRHPQNAYLQLFYLVFNGLFAEAKFAAFSINGADCCLNENLLHQKL
jgi:hypothetical protein